MSLKQALKDNGITQAELARRIGRSERMVRYYVSSGYPIPANMARLIAWATGIKMSVIQGDGRGE